MRSNLGRIAALLAALAMAVPATAHEAGTWILRVGYGMVSPKSDNLDFGETTLTGGGVIPDSYLEVDDGSSLVLSATYMIHDNWAIDILAAAPFEHDIDLKGTLDGAPFSAPVGTTDHLPPTLTLQYHFSPEAAFQPFVGVGVNHTLFFSESVSQVARDAVGLVDFELEDSYGPAFQVGADWAFGNNWLVNFDLRWIMIRSTLNITVDDGGTIISGITVPGQVEIDPWVFGVNVGYSFGSD